MCVFFFYLANGAFWSQGLWGQGSFIFLLLEEWIPTLKLDLLNFYRMWPCFSLIPSSPVPLIYQTLQRFRMVLQISGKWLRSPVSLSKPCMVCSYLLLQPHWPLVFLDPLKPLIALEGFIMSSWESSLNLLTSRSPWTALRAYTSLSSPHQVAISIYLQAFKNESLASSFNHNFLCGSNGFCFLAFPLNLQHLALCLARSECPVNVE